MSLLLRRRGVVSAAPAAGFSPLDIAGCMFWVKADQITGLSDGDPVSPWSDQSGEGNDVGQSTASKQPTYQTNVLNGMPVVRGDGTDDLLSQGTASNRPGADNWCMWGVWSNRATGTSEQVHLYLGAGGTEGYGAAVHSQNGNKGGLLGAVAWLESSEAEATGFETWVMQRRSGTLRLWIDGGAPVLTTTTAPNAPSDNLFLFHNNVHTAADVDIAECGIHDGATSLANAESLGDYLADRWGLTWTTATDT